MRKIVISGATGNTGFPTVNELSKANDVHIIAFTRDKKNKNSIALANLPNVEVKEINLAEPETFLEHLKDAQAVMTATPWNDLLENEINLINVAIRQGVEFLLKISTTSTTMNENSKVGYARKHLLIEKYLQESKRIKWAGLRPNEFIENRLGLGQVLKHSSEFPSIQGNNQSAMISVQDIGKVASSILLSNDWGKLNGKSLVLSGPQDTSDEILANILSEKLNKTIKYSKISEREMAKMFFGESVSDEIVEQMKEFNSKVKDGKHSVKQLPTDPEIFEYHKPSLTMDNVISQNIQLFE